ncbi:PhoH family protein [Rubellimicrobium roseum]|uniref:PhoH-like protein n=1 Tax=Rubellimicrobium roseum TaxID=687525 RepID=A0A5C4NAK0_9RHOB|nr:PhoH family protein [Rubellimicrobium roseum]
MAPRGACQRRATLPVTALNASAAAPANGETLLEFPDNYLLIDLCGEHDRNLAVLEDRIGVQILRRGNRLAVMGDAEARARAAEVLRALYQRLESGKGLDLGDIDRELRMGPAGREAGPQEGDQTEMFGKGGPADRVEIRTRRKVVEPRTEAQKAYVRALFDHELAFGIGPAGTGKTYLAVAVGVSMFLGGHVDKIILSRPAVEAGERLGFLPGDAKEKVDPYMQPLYDALNDFLPQKQVQKMIEEKIIEIAPLAFMRGRTLSNAFIVLDEAQNATSMQMKMFLTRLGEGSRMVITGDRTQIDLPRGVPSGLIEAERLLHNVPKISFTRFTARDVVRHPLVAAIIEAYDADARARERLEDPG